MKVAFLLTWAKIRAKLNPALGMSSLQKQSRICVGRPTPPTHFPSGNNTAHTSIFGWRLWKLMDCFLSVVQALHITQHHLVAVLYAPSSETNLIRLLLGCHVIIISLRQSNEDK